MYLQTIETIQQYYKDEVFSGAEYLFIEKEQSLRGIIGYAQKVPTQVPLNRDMLFDVASLTKVICTTTLVLKLYEKKIIELDAPISNYLPEFLDKKVTIRHLLTHTSDIHTFIPNRNNLSSKELRNAYMKVKSGMNLGNQVVYTDTGTILLGFMLETLLNNDLHSLYIKEILGPIRMKRSSFSPKVEECVATEKSNDGTVIKGRVHDPKAAILKHHCGSAGLFSSLSDLELFVHMLLNFGRLESGEQFLEKKTVELLMKDQTPSRKLERSLGWDLKQDASGECTILFHTGYTGTFMLIDIKTKSAFVFLSNRIHPKDDRDSYIIKRDKLIEQYLFEKLQQDEEVKSKLQLN